LINNIKLTVGILAKNLFFVKIIYFLF